MRSTGHSLDTSIFRSVLFVCLFFYLLPTFKILEAFVLKIQVSGFSWEDLAAPGPLAGLATIAKWPLWSVRRVWPPVPTRSCWPQPLGAHGTCMEVCCPDPPTPGADLLQGVTVWTGVKLPTGRAGEGRQKPGSIWSPRRVAKGRRVGEFRGVQAGENRAAVHCKEPGTGC